MPGGANSYQDQMVQLKNKKVSKKTKERKRAEKKESKTTRYFTFPTVVFFVRIDGTTDGRTDRQTDRQKTASLSDALAQ